MTNNNLKDNKCDTHGSNCDGACVDPNVDNGMMTKVWGPAGWLFLHCVSFGYPYAINDANESHKDKRDDYYNFFYYLGKVLPCRYCRESYEEFFKELDLTDHLNTRKQLTKWLYDMHNKVNHKLGVPDCNIPSFDELITRYESYRAKCKKTTDEERLNNQKKGCVTPANGTPQKCIVKVVSYNKGDITRRDNANSGYFNDTQDDYIVFKKRTILIILVALLVLIGAIIYFK